MGKDQLLAMIRGGQELTARQRLALVVSLSMPAMLSQLSTIVEEYVDAMMVGQMGAAASASIGLVSTSIWLIGGLSHAASTGFYVQVAHRIGANDFRGARGVTVSCGATRHYISQSSVSRCLSTRCVRWRAVCCDVLAT